MRRSFVSAVGMAALAVLVAGAIPVAALPAGATRPGRSCAVTALSTESSDYHRQPSIAVSGDGGTVAYVKGGRLFVRDVATNMETEVPYPPGAMHPDYGELPASSPSLSADGSRVAYLLGLVLLTRHGPVGAESLWVYDRSLDENTRVEMPGSWNRFAALSPDGTTLVSAGAHDHVFEAPRHLILHDLLTATSIEFGEAWLRSAPTISSDNARIAFDSSEDLTGDNPDRHTEIFVFNTSTGSLRQITSDPSYSSSSPRFLAAPRTLTFVSRREVGGSNSAHRRRTFLHDLRSRATTPLPSVVADGLVSGDGSSVAFTSTADLVGANDDANAELFTYDLASGVVGQHTSTTDEGHRPWAISDAGDLIALATPTDDTNRHHDLAIATTCAPAPRADAQLATATARRYAGEDIYAVHPVPAQRLQVPIAPGTSRSFLVRLQNDRAVPDALAVSGRDAGRPGYSVQYRQNGSDVTALVEAGDYTTGVLGTGASVVLQVKITADESVPRNARHRVDVTARSVANPVAGDAVRAQVTAVR